ncbi:FimV/HubP family polar landmark protein [Dyella sedimenti]|uniref:FimV/HubP family polar landmark protein n=1 Tax=Dyella sedimenti TaxID=2919947 RepID=UPI001FAA8403|nr:FimV/HubP family polar landmark protein [Dyella sedimenti]
MNRSLKLSMLLALALGSSQAVALELGQIQVKSALGQPLLAEIPVNPDSPAELQNLTARLASAEDAAQAGVAAGPAVPLQFAVVDGANGRKVIRITSSAPVNDPYLDLLVEVNNAAGKSLREFTILLDPPGSVAGTPATHAPAQAPAKPSRRAAPAPAETASQGTAPAPATPAPVARPVRPARAAAAGSYGPVESGQTLSGIAHETAPDGVDFNQMLLALKQANPDAFYRDNINALKSGVVLRVPSREDALATSAAAALAEVRRQNGDWRSGAARAPTTVADAGTRANASSSPAAAGPAGDHLALVPAKEGAGNAAQGGKGGDQASSKGMASLHQDLLRSQEALTSLQQQGDELKSRLKDLEDINGKNQRLLSLKDNEIADLQRQLAAARKAAGLPPAKAAEAPQPAAPEETVVKANEPAAAAAAGNATPPAGGASAATPAPVGAATAAKPVAPAKPVAKPATKPVPVQEEEPWYMQTWAWGAGAAVVVLLLLFGLRGRSRKPAAETDAAAAGSLADRFGTVPPAGPASADPDQDELLDQLAEHPDDIGLHLELVSLYYSRRDVEHFEAAAEAMHAHVADPQQPEWQDVVRMGEDLVPEHPLFAHAVVPPHLPEEKPLLDDFQLDRYAERGEADELPPIPSPPAPSSKVSEYHFDFDLTPRPSQPPASAPASEPAPAAAGHEPAEEESFDHASSWAFAEPAGEAGSDGLHHEDLNHELGQFSDDPVDTKLDLARAYLDMGDPDGAQAMLEEVMHEGTQIQKDVAKRLLDSIH